MAAGGDRGAQFAVRAAVMVVQRAAQRAGQIPGRVAAVRGLVLVAPGFDEEGERAAMTQSVRHPSYRPPLPAGGLYSPWQTGAALQTCRTDSNCGAAVDLDGTQFGPVVRLGLERPFLLLATGDSCLAANCRTPAAADATDQAVAQHLTSASVTDYGASYLAGTRRRLLPLGADGGPGLLPRLGDDVATLLKHS